MVAARFILSVLLLFVAFPLTLLFGGLGLLGFVAAIGYSGEDPTAAGLALLVGLGLVGVWYFWKAALIVDAKNFFEPSGRPVARARKAYIKAAVFGTPPLLVFGGLFLYDGDPTVMVVLIWIVICALLGFVIFQQPRGSSGHDNSKRNI